MRTVAEIDADIAQVKAEMQDVHGTATEVYARIVGYYRSVRNWNRGKREEYKHRKLFVAEEQQVQSNLPSCGCGQASESIVQTVSSEEGIAGYELFVRATCPNCPPVKEFCSSLDMESWLVDVDTAEGFTRASERGIFSAPTVVFIDSEGNEVSRAHSVKEIKAALSARQSEPLALGL